MHNIVDYYNKPGNENKRPHKTSSQKPSPPDPSKNKNQSFRAQLMKMLEKDSDNPDSPPRMSKLIVRQLRKSLILFPQVGRERRYPN